MSTRSKFNLGDQALSNRVIKGVQRGLSRVRGFGFVTDLFEGLFYFFISLGAFSIRVVIRRKLGERSFGVFTIIFTYIWIRMFYAYEFINISPCEKIGIFGEACDPLQYILYVFFIPVLVLIATMLPNVGTQSPIIFEEGLGNLFYLFNVDANGSFAGYYSLIFLICALFAFGEVIYRTFTKIRWYSFHRGKSIFNGLVGKKIGPLIIKDHHVWMIVEPIIISLLAMFSWQIAKDIIIARILVAGAVCLLIEEYSVYKQERAIVLDLIDQEIQADYITSIKNQYKEDSEGYKETGLKNDNDQPEITI